MSIKNYVLNKLAKSIKPFLNEKTAETAAVLELKDGKVKEIKGSFANSILPEQNITPQQAQQYLSLSFQRKPDFKITAAPKNGKYAMDSDFSAAANMYGLNGVGRDIIYSFFAKHGFIGWQICAMLAQHWLINRCCRIPNEDALSCGYDLHFEDNTAETDEQKKQNLKFLKDLQTIGTKRYKLHEKLLKWGFNRSVYGIGLAYFKIKDEDPATPLNLDGIKPNSFEGIAIVEPYWAFPEFSGTNISTPGSVDFYEPQYYNIGGQRVHISRLCVKVFSEVPDILKPSYYYGGIPLTQMMYERVYAAEKVCNEGPELALSKRTFILRTNLEQAITNPVEFYGKLNFMSKTHNNNGIWAIDRADNQETVEQLETTLSGLDSLTSEMYKYVAAVAGIPDNRLYAKSINGMASTGENEIKNYSQTLKTYQENCFDDFLIKAYQIIAKSDLNKTVNLGLTFKPIDTPTAAELAATQSQKAATYTQLIGAGAISAEEVRQALKNDENSGFTEIDAEMPEELEQEGFDLQDLASGQEESDTPEKGGLNAKEERNADIR